MDGTTHSPPQVGVVVPIAKVDHFAKEAVRSLISQTMPPARIVLVFDGCSPQEFLQSESIEIKAVHLEARSGISASRNAGLAACEGMDFIAILDSDDLALPTRLKMQAEFLLENPGIDAVGTGIQILDEKGCLLVERRVEPLGPAELVRRLPFRNVLTHSSVMVRRRAVLEVGGYDIRCRKSVDYDLWLRMALQGKAIMRIPEPLTAYRVHPGQISIARSENYRHLRLIARNRIKLGRRLGLPYTKVLVLTLGWMLRRVGIEHGLARPRWLRSMTAVRDRTGTA